MGAESGKAAFRSIVWRCEDKAREGEDAIFCQAWFYTHNYALIQSAMLDMLSRI